MTIDEWPICFELQINLRIQSNDDNVEELMDYENDY